MKTIIVNNTKIQLVQKNAIRRNGKLQNAYKAIDIESNFRFADIYAKTLKEAAAKRMIAEDILIPEAESFEEQEYKDHILENYDEYVANYSQKF